jgi:hypothetical protein
MAGKRTKGTKQLNVELPESLVDEFKQFCEGRGESPTHNVAVAIRRHMANPPPLPHTLPLPDSPPVPEESKPRKRGGKK